MPTVKDNRKTIPFRAQPDTVRRIDQWCAASGCKSRNEFIERAVIHYADTLAAEDNTVLPAAVKSVIDGRLGQFEQHMAYLLFKLAVETDMVTTLNAQTYEWNDDALHHLRADSVRNVRETNGRISFEQHARDTMDGDDVWPG